MVKYNAEQIEVLEGLEPVRLRPGMFIGSTDIKGLHHLVWEVTDNCVDEHLAGYCSKIDIIIRADGGVTISDNGRGIPVDEHPTQKKSALEVVMTKLHAGGKFGKGTYVVAGGLHGVGISVTNALSKKLDVQVRRDGYKWEQSYERGIPTSSLVKKDKIDTNQTGTTITFWPDPKVFPKTDFSPETIIKRMRETAFLNPNLKIKINNEMTGDEEILQYSGGLKEYITFINEEKDGLYPNKPIYFEGNIDDVDIAIAFQYSDQSGDNVISYCNTIATIDGGKHERGFKSGFTRVINNFARNQKILKEKDSNLDGDDIRYGMVAVVAVKVKNPLFEGQTKTRLGNEEVESAVSQLISEKLSELLETDNILGKKIVDRAITAQRAKAAAKSAAESIRKKNAGFSMANKLSKCSSKIAKDCELFIVEGDSAAGPAKRIRDSKTQAILPIRGKIINALKSRIDKLLENNEIQNLIYALGTGIANVKLNGNEDTETDSLFNIDNLNYHKIILLTDADDDGSHIQLLLLTFFFTYLKPIVENGHIYIAKPPLFKLTTGSKKNEVRHYALDEKELNKLVIKYPNGNITRYKGLGEMDEDELGETSINPNTRNIARVSIDDLISAEKMFSSLMGNNAGPRKEFLVKNASKYFSKIFEKVV